MSWADTDEKRVHAANAFCAVITLQQEHELRLVELFALRAKDAPHQQVHLLAQQLVLLAKRQHFQTAGEAQHGVC